VPPNRENLNTFGAAMSCAANRIACRLYAFDLLVFKRIRYEQSATCERKRASHAGSPNRTSCSVTALRATALRCSSPHTGGLEALASKVRMRASFFAAPRLVKVTCHQRETLPIARIAIKEKQVRRHSISPARKARNGIRRLRSDTL